MKVVILSLFTLSLTISCANSEFTAGQEKVRSGEGNIQVSNTGPNGEGGVWNPASGTFSFPEVNPNPVTNGGDPFSMPGGIGGTPFNPTPGSGIDPNNPLQTPDLTMNPTNPTIDPGTSTNVGSQAGTSTPGTNTNVGSQTGTSTPGTNTNVGSQTGSSTPGTNTNVGSQTGTPESGTQIGSSSGKPCTEGDFVNFKFPTTIQGCLNKGKLWDFKNSKCSQISAYSTGCSWGEAINLANSQNYQNNGSQQHVDSFIKHRNEGRKLAGCAKSDSKGIALFQYVNSVFDNVSCTYSNERISALCVIRDGSIVPVSIRSNSDALLKWCFEQQ